MTDDDRDRAAESAAADESGDEPTRVVAQGTFDLLHPGHVHYLEEAAAAGDELHVIVARAENIAHKPDPVLPDAQRRDTVAALEAVDHARLGHPEDFSVPISAIDPDVLVLGYDQHHDEDDVAAMLAEWGIDCRVERASPLESDDEILSSSGIRERVLERRAVELS
ncbi:adenylyltransferase/cytidyltransferase family protein [Halopiger aswanensis]|uniref:FAD synthase n=1 Tax=Halopiger aswanensis TaxID=148449 RepID=A0A3R7HWT9_9EURY|nr:adenylyltransferase/cytidyltransferase family protein [Halopiger aswanensis]RKD93748.1 FMN adenylyltransferase [Halopiger aswanensis]